jgi:hypothetical protein
MNANDLIMISVDDHVVEPPEMFRDRTPGKYADQAPKVTRADDGADVWVFNGSVIPNIGLNAVAGRPKEEYGIEPTAFDEVRPGYLGGKLPSEVFREHFLTCFISDPRGSAAPRPDRPGQRAVHQERGGQHRRAGQLGDGLSTVAALLRINDLGMTTSGKCLVMLRNR